MFVHPFRSVSFIFFFLVGPVTFPPFVGKKKCAEISFCDLSFYVISILQFDVFGKSYTGDKVFFTHDGSSYRINVSDIKI